MTVNLGRDYVEANADYEDAGLYAKSLGQEGRYLALPPVTCVSRIFSDLEDEKIWTRRWVAVGPSAQIPSAGDLLPYTVGNHGLHVERQRDNSLAARFNKAQHGGCRFVPTQCQTGRKTNCSYTSCGYSLDEHVIRYGALDDPNRRLGQYVGNNPARLVPATVREVAGQLFVHVDPVRASQTSLPEVTVRHFVRGYADAVLSKEKDSHWSANWKLLIAASLRAGASFCHPDSSKTASSDWVVVYPNLCIERHSSSVLLHVLQPVATNATRVITFSMGAAVQSWFSALREGCEAEQMHVETLHWEALREGCLPGFDYEQSPAEPQPAMHRFMHLIVDDLVHRYSDESMAVVYLDPAFSARRN